jgi:hypothetical protein
MRQVVAAFWVIVFFLHTASIFAEQKSACVSCHEFLGGELARPATEWNGSIHQQNGITCDLCHGGNPNVHIENIKELSGSEFAKKQALAMSTSHGFVGRPSGKALFDVCATCHAASVERYAQSMMGKAYLAGKSGPSCITCHHAHRNGMPEVPEVCTQCHKDTAGYDQIDPMNVTEATVTTLSGIRIKLKQKEAAGNRPSFIPEFPDLEAFQIGFVAFGGVIVLFLFGYVVYKTLERRK